VALHVLDLRKKFGGIVALDGCSFTCMPGTITGVVGPNGSGKSTLFNAVTGLVKADAGDVKLAELRLTNRHPHEIARAGIGRTFQTTRLFKSLSVLDNVLLGASAGASHQRTADDAHALLDRFGVAAFATRAAEALSFGQQRLVELARAVIGKPKFVLLDEPFAGLSPLMANDLRTLVAALPESGVGVMLIEHDLEMVTALCSRVLVLHRGRLIADGTPYEVRRNPEVVRSYLGEG
jgi:branched-chain amino acid transport system ATP-binding protein